MKRKSKVFMFLFLLIVVIVLYAFYNMYVYREQSFIHIHPEINETISINYGIKDEYYQNIEYDYDEFIKIVKDSKVRIMPDVRGFSQEYFEIRLDDGIIFDFYYNDKGYKFYGIIVNDLKENKYYFYKDIHGDMYKYLKSCLNQ